MNESNLTELIETLAYARFAIAEKEARDKEINDVRQIANKLVKKLNSQMTLTNQLKKDNHALQLFIEEHVDDEKKKLIFK